MTKVIDIPLTPAGIDTAIKQLRYYKSDFKVKSRLFRLRVAERTKEIAKELYASAWYNDFITGPQKDNPMSGENMPYIPLNIINDEDQTILVANNEVAVFIEFGAGVYYNGSAGSSPHPKGAELGFTIGSYPPAPSKGVNEAWTVMGEGVTRGTAAQKVLYNAVRYVQPEIEDIAKEVFKR